MYTNTSIINNGFPAPNVPVYCFYGTGVQTAESFVYGSGFPDAPPRVAYGDGDSIVNLRSSEVCLQWRNQGGNFTSMEFPGANHTAIVSDIRVLMAIENVVGSSSMELNISFGATLLAILMML